METRIPRGVYQRGGGRQLFGLVWILVHPGFLWVSPFMTNDDEHLPCTKQLAVGRFDARLLKLGSDCRVRLPGSLVVVDILDSRAPSRWCRNGRRASMRMGSMDGSRWADGVAAGKTFHGFDQVRL